MDFNLQRTSLESFRTVLDTIVVQEETMESIVPDAFPDVSRVICTTGNAYVTTKQAGKGIARIQGTAVLNILYVPEGDQAIQSISVDLPFVCTAECPQIDEHAQIHCAVISTNAETRLINPRKLFLKAEIRLHTISYNRECKELNCGIASEAPDHLQMLIKQYKENGIAAVLEKAFYLSDTMRPSSVKLPLDEILQWMVECSKVEAKYIGKKFICKGVLLLKVLYRSEQEVGFAQFEIPFSQIIEMEGNFNEGDPSVFVTLKSAACQLRDGEFDVSIEANLCATLRVQRDVSILCDAYSTKIPLDINRVSDAICSSVKKGSYRESGRKFCESGIPAHHVIQSRGSVGTVLTNKMENSVQVQTDISVSILYSSEDNALCNVTYMFPMNCEIDVASDLIQGCRAEIVGEVIAVPVTGGFETRFEVEFTWQTVEVESVLFVSKIYQNSNISEDMHKPSVIVRMAADGETLWDVAKACNSTIQDICTANCLTTETILPGSILLVPVKR